MADMRQEAAGSRRAARLVEQKAERAMLVDTPRPREGKPEEGAALSVGNDIQGIEPEAVDTPVGHTAAAAANIRGMQQPADHSHKAAAELAREVTILVAAQEKALEAEVEACTREAADSAL